MNQVFTRVNNHLPQGSQLHGRITALALLLAGLALALGVACAGRSVAVAAPSSASHTPDATCPAGGQCFADVAASNSFYDFVNRLYQEDLISGYPCGGPGEPCDQFNRPYYRPASVVTRQQMTKFIDNARHLPSIRIQTSTQDVPLYISSTVGNSTGIYGFGTNRGIFGSSSHIGLVGFSSASSAGYGVYGQADCLSCEGVYGMSENGDGVYGIAMSSFGSGVYGINTSSTMGSGVIGTSNATSNGSGVVGIANCASCIGIFGDSLQGLAGFFDGDVSISGTCSGCLGPDRIDHPLDPENKYLYHSVVESPDMKTIYDGNVTTDANGDAKVMLPDYFEALNRDFRYQLTVVGQFAQAVVATEIQDNAFTIKTDKPNVKVSWQVTGIRHDPYAEANRTPVEVAKTGDEKMR